MEKQLTPICKAQLSTLKKIGRQTYKPAEITTHEHVYEINSSGLWVVVDQYFFRNISHLDTIPMHAHIEVPQDSQNTGSGNLTHIKNAQYLQYKNRLIKLSVNDRNNCAIIQMT